MAKLIYQASVEWVQVQKNKETHCENIWELRLTNQFYPLAGMVFIVAEVWGSWGDYWYCIGSYGAGGKRSDERFNTHHKAMRAAEKAVGVVRK